MTGPKIGTPLFLVSDRLRYRKGGVLSFQAIILLKEIHPYFFNKKFCCFHINPALILRVYSISDARQHGMVSVSYFFPLYPPAVLSKSGSGVKVVTETHHSSNTKTNWKSNSALF